jgi:hypothetical protein
MLLLPSQQRAAQSSPKPAMQTSTSRSARSHAPTPQADRAPQRARRRLSQVLRTGYMVVTVYARVDVFPASSDAPPLSSAMVDTGRAVAQQLLADLTCTPLR